MNKIMVLDDQTIDKIAAGEVIERPASIVKELVENAIDAGATAVTVEIKEGGISLVRITDNGGGIGQEEIPTAFLRHATSKIRSADDLLDVSSLGFRGEALSSIAAVSQVELITKTPESLTGSRYLIEGGKEKSMEEIGAPSGTTFLVRNIFYNTPARKKFLKSAQTEAAYISDLMEHMALSHPEISFKFIQNGQNRLHTSGNHNLKDIIYHIYGREIAGNLLEIPQKSSEGLSISGFIGKPVIARGNRNYECYFVNGRYIRSKLISKAIEDAYQSFMMKHKYPFTVLHLQIDGELMDVNVHPAKLELRFSDNESLYDFIYHTVSDALAHKEMIPQVSVGKDETDSQAKPAVEKEIPEPFEQKRLEEEQKSKERLNLLSHTGQRSSTQSAEKAALLNSLLQSASGTMALPDEALSAGRSVASTMPAGMTAAGRKDTEVAEHQEKNPMDDRNAELLRRMEQLSTSTVKETDFFSEKLLDQKSVKEHRIIGQLFDTYWLIEFRDNLFIIDQHAAHEKVLYEKTMRAMDQREYTSQILNPPIILTMSMQEELLLKQYLSYFTEIGFEIEAFGGKEYALRAVPDNLFGIGKQDLFIEMLDSLDGQTEKMTAEMIRDRVATMSCKAAVKGNHKLSVTEVHALIDELMQLENPYHCPHGRPTIISMSKYEIEKKFKRIV